MTDPRDPQPYDPFEGPPTSPPSAPPTAPSDGSQPEYVIHHAPPQHESFGGSFQDAPDPFAQPGQTPATAGTAKKKGSAKRWIIPIAALIVIAMVAAGTYFLFFQSDDDDPTAGGSTTTSEPAERTEQSPSSETSTEPSPGSAAEPLIAGVFEVNGTVQSYTGPPTGQLGAPPKTAGSPAFTTPQTWTIDSCTDDTCELSITPGDVSVTLELDGDTWTGEGSQMIACDPAASATTEATLLLEISQDGSSATRTLNATCDEPLTEVNSLTLTAK